MRPIPFLSIFLSALALGAGIWLFFASSATLSLQWELQQRQDEIQTKQQAIQLQQQQLQAQQQQINTGAQLAEQIGPAVLRDLASLVLQNKNQKIRELLQKYGVEAKEAPATPATPATPPATTATP